MKLIPAEPNLGLPLARMASEGNIWEMGIYPVLFGYRVRAGRVGWGTVAVDYCAAEEMSFLPLLYLAIYRILCAQPEAVSVSEIERMMPSWRSRPICNDPICWPTLLDMAVTAEQDVGDCHSEVTRVLAYIETELERWWSSQSLSLHEV